jgi:hypothetical protein
MATKRPQNHNMRMLVNVMIDSSTRSQVEERVEEAQR